MRKTYLLLLAVLMCTLGMRAQVTTDPTPVQENTQNLKIYFHADQGNKGLMGLNANTKIYAHTGLITSKSTSPSDWKYTISDWDKDIDKAMMVYEGPNLWSLYIGDIRTFYGVKDMSEKIEKIAFVFRTTAMNGAQAKEGKTATGGDIMVNVVDPGLQVVLTSNLSTDIVDSTTGEATFTASTTSAANITISVNGTAIASQNNVTSLTANYTFGSMGDYTVTATATSGSSSVSDSMNFAYFSNPTMKAYPGAAPVMGPVTNSDGSVTFCVAAPEMTRMVLVGSWNDYMVTNEQQMYYVDSNVVNPITNEGGSFRYFWITIPDLAKTNDQYVYFFKAMGTITTNAGTMTVNTNTCDPYARLVLDPWNDKYIDTNVFPNLPDYPYEVVDGVPVAVYQKDINAYDWQCKDFQLPDKDNLIIYELLFRDFTGTEGKAEGNGTVAQAMEKINYLKELGVNVIELLPICEFNGNNSWGYNPNFYFAVDKAYGTPDDYKAFIDLCHQNGMAVVLDMVFNQSDGLHPWYQMYGGVQYSPFYNSSYNGQNGAPHAYSVLNDWNQDYPLVQQQWHDVIEYWLKEYNFDGFRFDLVKGLGQNQSYANSSESATNAYNASRVAEMAYLNGVIQDVKPGAYCINENLAYAKEENEMAQDGELNWANVNDAACQFAMGFPENCKLNRLYAPQDDSRLWGSTVSYLESHDEQRLAYKQNTWGVAAVKNNPKTGCQRLGAVAAIMMMTPGSHMIWMFSEMGNAQNTKKNDGGNLTDAKIVNWNLLNEPNHKALYDSYCQLIDLRFKNPEFFTQNANFQISCNASSTSSWPSNGFILYSVVNGKELVTAVNPNTSGNLAISYSFLNNNNDNYKVLSKSYDSAPSFDASKNTITVPANCYVVIGSVGLEESGIEGIAEEAKSLKVIGGVGEIEVLEAPAGVAVYSMDGKMVGTISHNGVLKVAKGFYLVKSGGESAKIVVK